MGRNRLLLIAVAVTIMASLPGAGSPVSAAGTGGCVGWSATEEGCTPESNGEFNGGGVDVSAGYDQVGGGGGGSGNGTGSGESAGDTSADDAGSEASDGNGDGAGNTRAGPAPIIRDGYTVGCIPNSRCDPNFVVRISDLVNFIPEQPTAVMEPEGWAVVGLPVNLVAEASTHTRSGMLLGYEAEVRFTPVRFQWDYGDGTRATTATGGAAWKALDLPEFSETATSHVFRTRGTWTVNVAVEYAADYRFADEPWQRIGGTLAVSSTPLTAVSLDARTVLVGGDCVGNPGGPGC